MNSASVNRPCRLEGKKGVKRTIVKLEIFRSLETYMFYQCVADCSQIYNISYKIKIIAVPRDKRPPDTEKMSQQNYSHLFKLRFRKR